MTKNIWSIAVALLLSFFIITSWQKSPSKNYVDSTQKIDESPVVIGYSNWAGWWPWAIAESEGLFAKYGVNVELKWYDSYTQSLEDLAVGHIDGNSQTLNDTISFFSKASSGEVAVLINDNSVGNDKIIAADGINTVKELKNRQVALEAGIVEDFLLSLALEKEGMSRNDVDIVDVETGAAVEAFVAGQIDAVGAFAPFWLTAIKRKDATEIVSSKDFPGAIVDLLVVTEELIEQRPDEVQAIVETWFDILDFIKANPAKADRIMAERAGIDYEQLKLFKTGTKILNLSENLEAFSKGNDMKHISYTASIIADFLGENFESIAKKIDLNKMFDPKFVIEAAKS